MAISVAFSPERIDPGNDSYEHEFVPRVAKRGAEIISVRGSSSAASAANAAISHIRDSVLGTPDGPTSAAVLSRGEYGVPEGLYSSFPVTSDGSGYRIIEGLDLDDRARSRVDASVAELVAERDAVREAAGFRGCGFCREGGSS